MNTTTITGNATDAPTVRFLEGGQAVCGFTVAHTPRSRTADGNWVDGQTSYLKVTVWGAYAENTADSVAKGDRVIVTGRLQEHTFTATRGERHGQEVRRIEMVADEVGLSTKWATVKATTTTTRGSKGDAEDEG